MGPRFLNSVRASDVFDVDLEKTDLDPVAGDDVTSIEEYSDPVDLDLMEIYDLDLFEGIDEEVTNQLDWREDDGDDGEETRELAGIQTQERPTIGDT